MENRKNLPIGVFDSGIGGLTVVKELYRQLPHESIIYFGDTARYPYGPRSAEVVERFALQAGKLLYDQSIKLLVVACNTASSVALDSLKRELDIPVAGVVKPGAQAAVEATRNLRVGIIGTRGTINSAAYQKELLTMDDRLKIFAKPCPLFVSLAQEGWLEGEVTELVAGEYLRDLKKEKVDTLILGCTHYPLLRKTIQRVMGKNVKLIDSAIATVEMVKELLGRFGLFNADGNAESLFLVSDAPTNFVALGSRFLNKKIKNVKLINIC